MLEINDNSEEIKLERTCQLALKQIDQSLPEFSMQQSDLLKLVLSENYKTCFDSIQIVCLEMKASDKVNAFEYRMCSAFIQHCLRTTFPEYRQNFIKCVRQFFTRIRTVNDKEIKAYVQQGQAPSAEVQKLTAFLHEVGSYIEANLYLDKPIEGAQPLFELVKLLLDIFGDHDFRPKQSQSFERCGLLQKEGVLVGEHLFYFWLNSLKSTWSVLRQFAFDILTRYPSSYPKFNEGSFVAVNLYQTALSLSQSPKAMMAEGSAFMLKLIFTKCLQAFDTNPVTEREKQLRFLQVVLQTLKERLAVFQQQLLKEGKKDCMLHGLLSFFKHLFADFKIEKNELDPELFARWRQFFFDLLTTCLEVSKVTSVLLSSNGLIGEEEGELQVDCRGHPMVVREGQVAAEDEDFENLVLVGVWLAVKENGLAMFNSIQWLELPETELDDSKFIKHTDIVTLCSSLIQMLFQFKHRGAIEKASECLSLICSKLFQSNSASFQDLPGRLLVQALEHIKVENVSTILRRSAGIPPTILAVLRAEPAQNEPVLLNSAIKFLLEQAQTATKEDVKVHSLNILRYIFQDSLLKHDIRYSLTEGMMLAMESFSADQWSVRNSALMAFTALTKRLLNTLNVQEQDLAKKRGLTTWEFFGRFSKLSEYFEKKLRECQVASQGQAEKEKSDLVIFSILLLISRLLPSYEYVEEKKMEEQDSGAQDEGQEEEKEDIVRWKPKEHYIKQYQELLASYSKNATYFVRKISAQALLPLIKFECYLDRIDLDFEMLAASLSQKLKQNEAHGIMVRINVFLRAYIKYNHMIPPPKQISRIESEASLRQSFSKIQDQFSLFASTYSKVTVALFLKCKLDFVKWSKQACETQFWLSEKQTILERANSLSPDEQILLRQILKLEAENAYLNIKTAPQGYFEKVKEAQDQFVPRFTDLSFKFFKSQYNNFKATLKVLDQQQVRMFQQLCTEQILPQSLSMTSLECKMIESQLMLVKKVLKKSQESIPKATLSQAMEILQKFQENPHILSVMIEIVSYIVRNFIEKGSINSDEVKVLASLIEEYSHMEQKELVRISTAKALAVLVGYMKLEGGLFSRDLQMFESFCKIFKSLVLLLNDEQFDIRTFLVNRHIQSIASPSTFSLSLATLSACPLEVTPNDKYLLEEIFSSVSQQVKLLQPELRDYFSKFVMQEFILKSAYRDHHEKNFEDKIFFFEPTNKFYDLLWVKKMALQNFREFQVEQSLIEQQIEVKKSIPELIEDQKKTCLEQTSEKYEAFVQEIIKHILRNPMGAKDQLAAFQDKYVQSLLP